jgi:hypothetical protein
MVIPKINKLLNIEQCKYHTRKLIAKNGRIDVPLDQSYYIKFFTNDDLNYSIGKKIADRPMISYVGIDEKVEMKEVDEIISVDDAKEIFIITDLPYIYAKSVVVRAEHKHDLIEKKETPIFNNYIEQKEEDELSYTEITESPRMYRDGKQHICLPNGRYFIGISSNDLEYIDELILQPDGWDMMHWYSAWIKLRLIPNKKGIYKLPIPAWSYYPAGSVWIIITLKKAVFCAIKLYKSDDMLKDSINSIKYDEYPADPIFMLGQLIVKNNEQLQTCTRTIIRKPTIPAITRMVFVCYNEEGMYDLSVVDDVTIVINSPDDIRSVKATVEDYKMAECDHDIRHLYGAISEISNILGRCDNCEVNISSVIYQYLVNCEDKFLTYTWHPLNVNDLYKGEKIGCNLNSNYNGSNLMMNAALNVGEAYEAVINWAKKGIVEIYIEGFNCSVRGNKVPYLRYCT